MKYYLFKINNQRIEKWDNWPLMIPEDFVSCENVLENNILYKKQNGVITEILCGNDDSNAAFNMVNDFIRSGEL